MDGHIGFDLKVENLKQQIINIVGSIQLPPSIIHYVLKDIDNEIYRNFQNAVAQQYEEFCEQAKREEEDKSNEEAKEEKDN